MTPTVLAGAAALVLAAPSLCQSPSPRPTPAGVMAGTPLYFEQNGGTYDHGAAFVLRGRGYQMFVTPRGTTLALWDASAAGGFAVAVRTVFVGANPAAEIRGEAELPTRVNYLRGARATWSTHNRTFARVRHAEVWPGIDVVYYECGTVIPGYGIGGGPGELLVDLVNVFDVVGPSWGGPQSPVRFSFVVPHGIVSGSTLHLQAALADPATGQTVLTDALDLTFGY